jgi:hypothetical protein
MRRLCAIADELRTLAKEYGCTIPKGALSPLHLTLGGENLAARLESYHITPEYTDSEWCVLLLGIGNTERDFERLRAVLAKPSFAKRAPTTVGGSLILPQQACSVREAAFAKSCEINVDDATGKIAAGMVTACPPGVPILIPGERIDKNLTILLKNSGVLSINVLL